MIENIRRIRPVDIRQEMTARPLPKGLERSDRHLRPEMRAANADIDHIGDLAARALVALRPHPPGKALHPFERVADLGHHIAAIDLDRTALEIAQRRVQHRPPLGLVDPRAGKHRIAPRRHPRRLGPAEQCRPVLAVEMGLGIIKEQPVKPDGKRLGPACVLFKQRQNTPRPRRFAPRFQLVLHFEQIPQFRQSAPITAPATAPATPP